MAKRPKPTKFLIACARRYSTLEAMASDVGLTQGYLSKIGRGYRLNVSDFVVSKLARALGRTEAQVETMIRDAQRVGKRRRARGRAA